MDKPITEDRSRQLESLPPKERALGEMAQWWGDRLVCRGIDLLRQPFSQQFFPEGAPRPFYALVTHHVKNEEQKRSVQELGGVIGHPEIYSLFYGKDASGQVLKSIGIGLGLPLGGVSHDGLTHVYLHPLPDTLTHDCQTLLTGDGPLARMFSSGSENPVRKSKFAIELVLQAPWVGLPTDLTNDPEKLRKALNVGSNLLSDLNFKDDSFVYALRMLRNEHLLAVV